MQQNELAQRHSPVLRALESVIRLEQVLIELIVVALALLICAEVFCRSFLGFSLMFTDEVAGYMLVAIVFLGMPVALSRGALFRVELVLNRMPPGVVRWVQLLFNVLSLGVSLMLLWQMVRLVIDSWERRIEAPTVLATPLYIPQIFMVLGLLTLVLVLVLHLTQGVADVRKGANHE